MLLAAFDGLSIFILLAVLGWLGHLLIQSLSRLKSRERLIYRAACCLAVVSGLFMFGWGLERESAPNPDTVLGLLIPAIATALISAFGWYFAVAVLYFVWEYVVAVPLRMMSQFSERKRQWLDRRGREADAARDELRRAEQRRSAAEQRSQEQTCQSRREDARAECDALYALAAPEIGSRFSKQDFNEFLTKYMSDASPPEAVEQRAEQLKKIIREHEAKVEPPPKFRSLQELSAWFEQQMADLQSVPDEKMRKSLAAKLKAKYSDLTSEMVSEISP